VTESPTMRVGALGAVLVCASCSHAPQPSPPDLQSEIERVRKAAERLVAFDMLSTAAAPVVRKVRHLRDPPLLAMMALRTAWAPSGSVVFVVARPEGGVQVLYEARILDGMRGLAGLRRLDDPRPLVGEEEEVWWARSTVLAEFADGLCGMPVEILVLPREAPDATFDVYPVPLPRVRWAQERITIVRKHQVESSSAGTMELVLTGQHRFHVSADGRQILERTRMSGDCQVRKVDHVRGNGDFIEFSDDSVDVPNETQLMESAILDWSFRITTRRGVWDVARGNLSLVGAR